MVLEKPQLFKAFSLFEILEMAAVELWQYAIWKNADVNGAIFGKLSKRFWRGALYNASLHKIYFK